MFNVRLAGGHLYGKQLFTWLSLVVSLMASFVLSFFPLDVLDEIWDLIESVSEGFLTYFFIGHQTVVWFPLVSILQPRRSTFTEKDLNKLNYLFGSPIGALSPNLTRLCGPRIGAITFFYLFFYLKFQNLTKEEG